MNVGGAEAEGVKGKCQCDGCSACAPHVCRPEWPLIILCQICYDQRGTTQAQQIERLRAALEAIDALPRNTVPWEIKRIVTDALTPPPAPAKNEHVHTKNCYYYGCPTSAAAPLRKAHGCDCSEPNGHAKDCAIWVRPAEGAAQ